MKSKITGNAHSPKKADSLAQAAAVLGVEVSELKAAKKAGCPGFENTRVEIEKVRQWLRETPAAPKDDTLESKDTLERRKLRAQYLKEEFRLDVEKRRFVAIEEVRRDLMRIGNAQRSELARFIGDLPNFAGLPAAEIYARGQKWMQTICANLSDATSKLYA